MKESKSKSARINHHTTDTETNRIVLSQREFQILEYISFGYTGRDIADRLYVSPHTVISHRRNLLDKFQATTSACLVRRAFEFGVLTLSAHVA